MDYNFDLHTMSRKSAGLPLAFSLGMLIFDLNDFIFLPLFKMAIELLVKTRVTVKLHFCDCILTKNTPTPVMLLLWQASHCGTH